MAIVVFDPAAFKLAYPEFANVPDARCNALFDIAQYTLLDRGMKSVTIYGVANNVFDQAPGKYFTPNVPPYDLIGRMFRMGVRFKY